LIEIADRFFVSAKRQIAVCPVGPKGWVAVSQPNRLAEIRDGLFGASLHKVEAAAIAVGIGKVLLHGNRTVVIDDRGLVILLREEGMGAIVEGLRVRRIETYCGSVILDGKVQFRLMFVDRTEIIMDQRAVGVEAKRLHQVVAGPVEFATMRPDERPIDVEVRKLREECDRRIEIAKRTVAQTERFVGDAAAVK